MPYKVTGPSGLTFDGSGGILQVWTPAYRVAEIALTTLLGATRRQCESCIGSVRLVGCIGLFLARNANRAVVPAAGSIYSWPRRRCHGAGAVATNALQGRGAPISTIKSIGSLSMLKLVEFEAT
ncbi:hypothetical protein J6590_042510 [Homalodisca vitripennis]|nr:hypothetical protein J6590_042510 [Homalodisca vitripennis]